MWISVISLVAIDLSLLNTSNSDTKNVKYHFIFQIAIAIELKQIFMFGDLLDLFLLTWK